MHVTKFVLYFWKNNNDHHFEYRVQIEELKKNTVLILYKYTELFGKIYARKGGLTAQKKTTTRSLLDC